MMAAFKLRREVWTDEREAYYVEALISAVGGHRSMQSLKYGCEAEEEEEEDAYQHVLHCRYPYHAHIL